MMTPLLALQWLVWYLYLLILFFQMPYYTAQTNSGDDSIASSWLYYSCTRQYEQAI